MGLYRLRYAFRIHGIITCNYSWSPWIINLFGRVRVWPMVNNCAILDRQMRYDFGWRFSNILRYLFQQVHRTFANQIVLLVKFKIAYIIYSIWNSPYYIRFNHVPMWNLFKVETIRFRSKDRYFFLFKWLVQIYF